MIGKCSGEVLSICFYPRLIGTAVANSLQTQLLEQAADILTQNLEALLRSAIHAAWVSGAMSNEDAGKMATSLSKHYHRYGGPQRWKAWVETRMRYGLLTVVAEGVAARRRRRRLGEVSFPEDHDEVIVFWDGNRLAYPHRPGFRPVSCQMLHSPNVTVSRGRVALKEIHGTGLPLL